MATRKKPAIEPTPDAAFVFIGKVVKTKAATIDSIAGNDTAIVEVQRVVKAPEMFASVAGSRITARFKKPSDMKSGAIMTFFANGWIFGSGIAVDVAATAAESAPQMAARMVRTASTATSDNVLRERIDSAKAVVAGRVAAVEQPDVPSTHISEHDPHWREAVIKVDEVVKGRKDVGEMKVLFPASDDVRWHDVPKYAPGQQGVFLLQPGKKQQARGIPPKRLAAVPAGDVLTTLHPCDFLPLHELERVKSLAGK